MPPFLRRLEFGNVNIYRPAGLARRIHKKEISKNDQC